MGGCRHPVPQQSSIPPLEEHSQSSPEMGSSLSIWLTGVPGQCRGNLLHFPLCYLVPTPKGLCGEGEEGNPLLPAGLCCSRHFSLIGESQGVTGSRSSSYHCCILKGVHNSDVKGSVSAPSPVPNKDICWTSVISRQQEPSLKHVCF